MGVNESGHLRAQLPVFRPSHESPVRQGFEDVQLAWNSGVAQRAVHAHSIR